MIQDFRLINTVITFSGFLKEKDLPLTLLRVQTEGVYYSVHPLEKEINLTQIFKEYRAYLKRWTRVKHYLSFNPFDQISFREGNLFLTSFRNKVKSLETFEQMSYTREDTVIKITFY